MFFFFFNDTATTEIYTLSLHDALPISCRAGSRSWCRSLQAVPHSPHRSDRRRAAPEAQFLPEEVDVRSEEHTSELQSLAYLVCRLLLEKKKKTIQIASHIR